MPGRPLALGAFEHDCRGVVQVGVGERIAIACFLRSYARILTVRSKFVELHTTFLTPPRTDNLATTESEPF